MKLWLAAVGAILLFASVPAADVAVAQQRFVNGLFVSTPSGPVELITYAEQMHHGQLKIQYGSLEDIPTVKPWPQLRILSSIPLWKPMAVLVGTGDIFRKQEPETRRLTVSARQFNVYATEVRASDLESVDKVAALFRAVRASEDAPGYVFVVLLSDSMTRFYPIRFSLEQ